MSERSVRAALQDLADETPSVDLVEGVWRTAVRRRRRRRVAGAFGALACVVAVGLVGHLGTSQTDRAPAPANPDRTLNVDGHRVWLAPSLSDEPFVPVTPSTLPGTIEIPRRPQVGGSAAVAAIARTDPQGRVTRVLLVDRAGRVDRLETDTMDLVIDPFAGSLSAESEVNSSFTPQSLSPGGRSIAFVTDKGFVIADIVAGGFDFIEVPGADPNLLRTFHWTGERFLTFGDQQVDVRTGEVGPAEPLDHGGQPGGLRLGGSFGQSQASPAGDRLAQSGFPVDVPVGLDAGSSTPQAVVVEGTGPTMLVLGGRDRTKGCCPVVGWLDGDRVVYQSRTSDEVRLLVWDTSTGAVTRLTDLTGVDGSRVPSFGLGARS